MKDARHARSRVIEDTWGALAREAEARPWGRASAKHQRGDDERPRVFRHPSSLVTYTPSLTVGLPPERSYANSLCACAARPEVRGCALWPRRVWRGRRTFSK